MNTGMPTEGFTTGFHNLRHTLGARLRSVGAPDYIISQFLGHTGASITQHYSAADFRTMLRFA